MKGAQPFVFCDHVEAKRYAPATERNREAIGEVLLGILPPAGLVLEVASGTGEHAVHFAHRFRALNWQPSDPDPAGLVSIEAWRQEAALPNLLSPIALDAAGNWPIKAADAVICINMVHISPWAAALGLFASAAKILPNGAPVYFYGPYRRNGVITASSNEEFDASLKLRNSEWGLRNVEDMTAAAEAVGLTFDSIAEMPANNLSIIYRAVK